MAHRRLPTTISHFETARLSPSTGKPAPSPFAVLLSGDRESFPASPALRRGTKEVDSLRLQGPPNSRPRRVLREATETSRLLRVQRGGEGGGFVSWATLGGDRQSARSVRANALYPSAHRLRLGRPDYLWSCIRVKSSLCRGRYSFVLKYCQRPAAPAVSWARADDPPGSSAIRPYLSQYECYRLASKRV